MLAGVLVGTLLGPPLAHAAGSLVTIASGSKASQLHIAKGKAKVDTGAALVPSLGLRNGFIDLCCCGSGSS